MSSQATKARKVAIVTGAANGIGKAIALRLIKDGFNLVICDLGSHIHNLAGVVRELEGIAATVQSSDGLGVARCEAMECDVTQEDQVQRMVNRAVELFGRLDCMVANAGIFSIQSLADISVETFHKVMDVNALGTLLCFRTAAAAMVKYNTAKGGRLIAAASGAAKKGYPLHGAYCASKFAVRALVHTAAAEYAEFGITVNAYAPGMIDTPLTQGLTSEIDPKKVGMTPQQFQQAGTDMSLVKRIGQPEDVAGLVSYLTSEESSFMTGQSISIDGGILFS